MDECVSVCDYVKRMCSVDRSQCVCVCVCVEREADTWMLCCESY